MSGSENPEDLLGTDIAARQLSGDCMREPSGRWQCTRLARPNLFGPPAMRPKSPDLGNVGYLDGYDESPWVVSVSAGWVVCALLRGAVYCSGMNDSGALGAPTQDVFVDGMIQLAMSKTPVLVPGTKGAIQLVAVGDGACALIQPGGTVRCWGNESQSGPWKGGPCASTTGEITGNKSNCIPKGPHVPSGLPRVKYLASAGDNCKLAAAVGITGSVYFWKEGETHLKPTKIAGVSDATVVSIGSQLCTGNSKDVMCLSIDSPPPAAADKTEESLGQPTDYGYLGDVTELVSVYPGPCVKKKDQSVWCPQIGKPSFVPL